MVRQVTRGQELRPGRLQVREQEAETSSQHGVCDAFEDHVDLSGSGFVALADAAAESAKTLMSARYDSPVLLRIVPVAGPPRSAESRPIVAME